MMNRLFSLVAALGLLASFAHAQQEALLTAELIPESSTIAPGKPFTVAVKMKHIEHGHSYWKNPGGPGKATKLKWTLPEGFAAGEPQWPAPKVQAFSGFTIYGYEGEAVVLVTITPPSTIKVGEQVGLETVVDALVCTDNCSPVKAPAKAMVTVADQPGAPDGAAKEVFVKARQALPIAPKGWKVSVVKTGEALAIALTPETGAAVKLTKAYFFAEKTADGEEVTDSQKPQELVKEGDHWLLKLPAGEAKTPEELVGIVTADEGWLEGDGVVKAFEVKLPVKEGNAEASAAPAATTGAPVTGGYGTLTLLAFAFLGGLILNIMPCVFPVLGIKIMGFVQQAGDDKKQIFMHGVAYTAGVLVCFWALAILVIVLGKGWGSQLQSPWFVLCLCYFFMAFGLNMAGVFEVGTAAIGVGQELQSKSGIQGSFFSGLLATVVATPCSAPFLGPALAWAISLPALMALVVFTVIGLGLSSPYLVLSLAPGLVRLLPRPGAWMESFKQGMSFLLFGTAGYMFWVLTGMVGDSHSLSVIFGLVLVAMACWIYGRWNLPHKPVSIQRRALIVSVLALAAGLWLGWPTKSEDELKWVEWSPEAVQKLRDEGKPVYIDFTAKWCVTCQVNHRVYAAPELKALFRKYNVVLMKADYTNYDERIKDTLRHEYQSEAVPVNVLYIPGVKQAHILPNPLTVGNVTEALNRLGKS